jgi:hypothetical protein
VVYEEYPDKKWMEKRKRYTPEEKVSMLWEVVEDGKAEHHGTVRGPSETI